MNVLTEMGFDIPVKEIEGEDFLSLTAMCKSQGREPKDTIRNYVSNSSNARYILAWNTLFNPEHTCAYLGAGAIPKISTSNKINIKRLISCGVFDRACRESILAKRLEDGRWKKNYKRMKEAEDDFFTKRDSKEFREMVKSTITEFAKGTLTIDDEG